MRVNWWKNTMPLMTLDLSTGRPEEGPQRRKAQGVLGLTDARIFFFFFGG
jgi:hypothetical protein